MYPISSIRDLQVRRRTAYISGYDPVSMEQQGAESNPIPEMDPAWERGEGIPKQSSTEA